mgnify:CR=1 FL=1
MRSPHTIEIQFVFNNIKIAGPLISKMPGGLRARRQDELGVGGVCAHRRSEHAEAATMAGLLRDLARHDAVQQRMPGRAGSGSRSASGDGAGAET